MIYFELKITIIGRNWTPIKITNGIIYQRKTFKWKDTV